jgi:acyl-CoA thioesterase I
VEVIDAGVSGDTASGGLARLDWSVPDKTDAVILELGANDALRAVDPAETRKALDEILRRLKERKIAVLLAGMQAPPNMGGDYSAAFNRIYPELAQKHDVPLLSVFSRRGRRGRKAQSARRHPSDGRRYRRNC